MAHVHDRSLPLRAEARQRTLSLLRMSAGQRLAIAGGVLALLWAATALVLA